MSNSIEDLGGNKLVEANIAIVLTDIIGSTKFVQKNGSRVAAQWFGIHDKAVMNFIQRHNGQLVDASDGHLMYFGSVPDAIAFAFDYKKFLRVKKFPFSLIFFRENIFSEFPLLLYFLKIIKICCFYSSFKFFFIDFLFILTNLIYKNY